MKARATLFLLMIIACSPMGAVQTGWASESGKGIKKERIDRGRAVVINEEDVKPGVRQMEMDGLSVAAHSATMAGLASFFLLPPLSLLLLPAGFIMGMIAWRSKKRYEKRRGKGLALAAVAIGGAFTLAIAVSLVALIITFGIY